eukprot:TRINITY_DN599_c0_g1_i1.p1 TRINITY_DN599_c0_g1~~TRINITY_DN599_c0_g1_i1.p1  ORF type:complete len:341 (+),score=101.60 TRINITY_DN599_c0_g1_i1:152-1174(+)
MSLRPIFNFVTDTKDQFKKLPFQQKFFVFLASFIVMIVTYKILNHYETQMLMDGLPSTICYNRPRAGREEFPDKNRKFTEIHDIFNNNQIKSFTSIENELIPIVHSWVEPHYEKKYKNGGEDAIFISSDKLVFGVADGVGGWNDEGVDPSIYSRKVVDGMERAFNEGYRDPVNIMCIAEENGKNILGSSTITVISFDKKEKVMYSGNLGDSGFMVVRRGFLIFASPEIQHEFNFPFQIGAYGDGLDATQIEKIKLIDDDIIVMGSDGLFDNLFKLDIIDLLLDDEYPGNKAEYIALTAEYVSRNAIQLQRDTPYAKRAREAGLEYEGGKPDDISVIVIYV